MNAKPASEKLTYGSYLRVPEITGLQSPRTEPPVHDEMLFIIGQQVQELWFKQLLHDLRRIIDLIDEGLLIEAARLVDRVNRILRVLSSETEVLETLAPQQFLSFRSGLKTATGFESEQFRELEIASGLREDAYLKMAAKILDIDRVLARWPRSLHNAFITALCPGEDDAVEALVRMYAAPGTFPAMYLLAEALSEYEMRFREWRFHHLLLVERVIGDRSPGTGGSSGGQYLAHTLDYRFFPELWLARNSLSSAASPPV
ncbi:MAG: tryptophan 2,3-dioxygenase [Chloroflexota bacterium]